MFASLALHNTSIFSYIYITLFLEDGKPLLCHCKVASEVDLTSGQSYTAGRGCPGRGYHLTKWHDLILVRDLEGVGQKEQLQKDKKDKDTTVLKKRRNSV